MNVKKQLIEQLVQDLQMRFQNAQFELQQNKKEIQRLAVKQKELKEKCGAIGQLRYKLIASLK